MPKNTAPDASVYLPSRANMALQLIFVDVEGRYVARLLY